MIGKSKIKNKKSKILAGFTPQESRSSGGATVARGFQKHPVASSAFGQTRIYREESLTGFTLIEMLVALGLFSLTIVILMGSLFSMIDAQRKVVFIRQVHDNARFAMERITRELRTANPGSLDGSPSCGGGNPGIQFINAKNDDVRYCYDAAEKRITRENITQGEPAGAITDTPPVEIEGINFKFDGQGANQQPRVRISMRVKARDPRGRVTTSLDIQSSISILELKD